MTRFCNFLRFEECSFSSRAEHPLARKIIHKLHYLKLGGKGVELYWVPSHVRIFGNERVDKLASDAAKQQETLIPIDYRDFSTT